MEERDSKSSKMMIVLVYWFVKEQLWLLFFN
jgi:hypothetical protein